MGAANLTLGVAALTLAQLVAGLADHDQVECEVNLQLNRGKGFAEPAGVVRLKVALTTN